MSVRYCGNEKRSQSVGKAKRNITFQNTFASTETQQHVKPLRMIDEVCFEMANKRGTQQWKKLESIGLQAQKLDKLENV